MKYIKSLLCFFFLTFVSSQAAIIEVASVDAFSPAFIGSGQTASSAVSYTCVGWATTNCVSDSESFDGDLQKDVDYTALTKWTADEAGTGVEVRMRAGTAWNVTSLWVVLYRDIGGTVTLVGKASVTPGSADEWKQNDLVAEGGQTLAFSNGDDLYFGASYDPAGVSYMARNDAGGTGLYYSSASTASGPPATLSLTTSGGREMGFILKYE